MALALGLPSRQKIDLDHVRQKELDKQVSQHPKLESHLLTEGVGWGGGRGIVKK